MNTDSGLRKIAETVEEYNGEFIFENVKNLKIKLLGLELDPDTVENYIKSFSNNLIVNKNRSFLKGKIVKLIYKTAKGGSVIYVFNNSRYYLFDKTNQGERFILNVNQKENKILNYGIYGIYDKGTYFNLKGNLIYEEPEKQEEYKKCFLEGK